MFLILGCAAHSTLCKERRVLGVLFKGDVPGVICASGKTGWGVSWVSSGPFSFIISGRWGCYPQCPEVLEGWVGLFSR